MQKCYFLINVNGLIHFLISHPIISVKAPSIPEMNKKVSTDCGLSGPV